MAGNGDNRFAYRVATPSIPSSARKRFRPDASIGRGICRIRVALCGCILAEWQLPSRLSGGIHDCIRVVCPVGGKGFPFQPFDQRQSLRAIGDRPRRDRDSDRWTIRIAGQMHLGVPPPFAGPIPPVPPAAPAACRCALTWLASTMSHSMSGSSRHASGKRFRTPASLQRMKHRWGCSIRRIRAGGRARALPSRNPANGIDEPPVVLGDAAPDPRAARKDGLDFGPDCIGNAVAVEIGGEWSCQGLHGACFCPMGNSKFVTTQSR